MGYQEDFIDFLLGVKEQPLKAGGDYTLKSKRLSPLFVNIGDFNDGETTSRLASFYADAIVNSGVEIDSIYGIPEKGVALSIATAIEMSRKGKNVSWFFKRKMPKTHGETSNMSRDDKRKEIVGRKPVDGERVGQIDDVFTTGEAKYDAIEDLRAFGEFKLPLLAIAVDRQEVMADARGISAIEEYEAKTGTKVASIVNTVQIYNRLKEVAPKMLPVAQEELGKAVKRRGELETTQAEMGKALADLEKRVSVISGDAPAPEDKGLIAEYETIKGELGVVNRELAEVNKEVNRYKALSLTLSPRTIERMANYWRVYGTKEARAAMGKLEQTIITRDRSVIPACDVETIEQYEELVKQTADVDGIGGYKVGFELGYGYGLPRIVEVTRKHTQKPIIFDHQKAATDIPDTGKNFARVMKKSGVDAVIFFPQAGPETERAWIYHAYDAGLKVIVGGRMTHPAYAVSEGGFIADEGALDMYRIGARAGVTNFVVPGNKPDVIKLVRETVEAEGIQNPVFYSPGLVEQGGKISDAAKAAGDRFHGIVGRGIYSASDMHAAAVEHCSQL